MSAPAPSLDDWRRWIAENLLLETSPNAMYAKLVQEGFAAEEAVRELEAALTHPYLVGAARMRNRLAKREWTLSVLSRLDRMRAGSTEVPRKELLSREEFFEEHYFRNRPVVITGRLASWPALRRWDLAHFREHYGDRKVEVQFGRDSDPEFEINREKHVRTMLFGEYVDLVERSGPTNDFYMTANNTGVNREALAGLWNDVETVTEYLDPDSPDTGFFWLGPAGTKTPFHHDLTNNFMAQVVGRKKVKLIPMTDTAHVYNHFHCYSQVDGSGVDYERFPAMRETSVVECVIGPGDLLFIPIGWWHYVEGLDVSVTMSFINFRERNDFSLSYRTYHDL